MLGRYLSFGERGRTGGRMVLLPEHAKRLFPVPLIPMRLPGKGGLALAKLAGAELPQGVMGKVSDMNEALLFYDEHTFGYCESVRDPYGRETWEQRSLKQSYAWEAYRHAGCWAKR